MQTHSRGFVFGLGDCAFLALVGGAATLTMQAIHGLNLSMPVTWLTGMVLAMLAQMLLAASAAPLLGSIESMVPSMILAMVSPMAICVLEAAGRSLAWPVALAAGAASGAIMFLFVSLYGHFCRRRFSRMSSG